MTFVSLHSFCIVTLFIMVLAECEVVEKRNCSAAGLGGEAEGRSREHVSSNELAEHGNGRDP